MATAIPHPTADPASPATGSATRRTVLGRLRRRIRLYLFAEGLFAGIAWVLGVFWAAMALDYLPVRLGADELPWAVRVAILGVTAIGLGWIGWRYVGRRVFRPLTDASLALLIERSHRQFGDSLVTAVELERSRSELAPFDPAMFARTAALAETGLPEVKLGSVFNAAPVGRKALLAGLLVAVTVVFGVLAPQAFATGVSRLLLLSADLWPRIARIEVVGLRLAGVGADAWGPSASEASPSEAVAAGTSTPAPSDPEADPDRDPAEGTTSEGAMPRPNPLVMFDDNRTIRLARGVSATLLVRADTSAAAVPRQCTLRYQTADGTIGWTYLRQDGSPRDGYQQYSYDGKPFRTLTGTVTFSVTGDDHRLSGFQIDVVEPPAIVGTEVACVYPSYLVDEGTGRFLPRTLRYGPGLAIPVGTDVTLRCRANKPLAQAVVTIQSVLPRPEMDAAPANDAAAHRDGDPVAGPTSTTTTIAVTGETFDLPLGVLGSDTTVRLRLTDAEGVTAQEVERIVLVAQPDKTPEVDLRLVGIGSAVTPDVRIPLAGQIVDDHGLSRTWFDVTVGENPARRVPFPTPPRQETTTDLDFRALRTTASNPVGLLVGGQMTLQVFAADRYDLFGQSSQVGSSDPWSFDVVTPEELIRRLELVEAGYRKQLEKIIEEVTQTRDELIRVKFDALATPTGPPAAPPTNVPEPTDADPAEPVSLQDGTASDGESGDGNAPGAAGANTVPATPPAAPPNAPALDERRRTLRTLRVQQATVQAEKNGGEVRELARAFLALRQELENNRVDAAERRQRLEVEVSQPLAATASDAFPEFSRRLAALEAALGDPQLGLVENDAAIAQADAILVSLDGVLQKLIKFEGYNELLEIVRSILDDQQDLERQTREEQERQTLESLLE